MCWRISSQSLEIRVHSGPHSLGMAPQTLIYQSFVFPSLGKLPSSPLGSAGKESGCNVGDLGSIPGLGMSPGDHSQVAWCQESQKNKEKVEWGLSQWEIWEGEK